MATTYLSRTQGTGSTDAAKKFTVSLWIKRGGLGVTQVMWSSGTGLSDGVDLYIDTNNNLYFESYNGSANPKIITDREFRDVGAWYHIMYAVDTTQATPADTVKFYVNGVQETSFSTSSYPVQDSLIPGIGVASDVMKVGTGSLMPTKYWDGVMAHVHYTDGQVYAPTAFGETDATSGIWVAKPGPSVTYGNNGFFLKFQDAAAYGDDSSGNTNDFAVGAGTMTQTKDTPDNNFCTMNPLDNYYQGMTYTQGNNTIETDDQAPSTSTIGLDSGKWYCEGKAISTTSGTDWMIGIISNNMNGSSNEIGHFSNDWGYKGTNGSVRTGNTDGAYGNTWGTGDILGIALDLTNNKLYFSINGVWQNSGVPTSGATGTGAISISLGTNDATKGAFFIAAGCETASEEYTWSMNFGNGYFGTTSHGETNADDAGIGLFKYDVPAGYYAICTNNLGDQS